MLSFLAFKVFQQLLFSVPVANLEGGPHENQIAALAVAMREASQPEFKEYVKLLKSNARTLSKALIDLVF